MLKSGVLDPQGDAVQHALGALGFNGVEQVRQGKVIDLELADICLLYTSPSPRDRQKSRMPSSA